MYSIILRLALLIVLSLSIASCGDDGGGEPNGDVLADTSDAMGDNGDDGSQVERIEQLMRQRDTTKVDLIE